MKTTLVSHQAIAEIKLHLTDIKRKRNEKKETEIVERQKEKNQFASTKKLSCNLYSQLEINEELEHTKGQTMSTPNTN